MDFSGVNDTPTELAWKEKHHFHNDDETDNVNTIIDYDEDNQTTTLEDVIKQPEVEPTPIEKELEEPPIELDVEPVVNIEEQKGELETQKGDVMARIENGEVELSEPASPFAPLPDMLQVNDTNYTYRAYSDTVRNYIRDVQQVLVDQMSEIEKSNGNTEEVEYLVYMLAMYVKSYCEITGDNMINIPLAYIQQKNKWKTSPFDYLKAYYTFGKNTLSVAQTRDGQMKLGFYSRN